MNGYGASVVVVVLVDVVVRIGGNVSAAPVAAGPHADANDTTTATMPVGMITARCMTARSYVRQRTGALSIEHAHQRTIDVFTSASRSDGRDAARLSAASGRDTDLSLPSYRRRERTPYPPTILTTPAPHGIKRITSLAAHVPKASHTSAHGAGE